MTYADGRRKEKEKKEYFHADYFGYIPRPERKLFKGFYRIFFKVIIVQIIQSRDYLRKTSHAERKNGFVACVRLILWLDKEERH
jgi:hypothetical protein